MDPLAGYIVTIALLLLVLGFVWKRMPRFLRVVLKRMVGATVRGLVEVVRIALQKILRYFAGPGGRPPRRGNWRKK